MESNFTLSIHGVELGLLFGIVVLLFKQYGIYNSIRERVNIMWRDYCILHKIPYNALGDDKLMDVQSYRNGDNK